MVTLIDRGNQTRLRFVLDASGFGVGFFGRLFALIYRRNLERSIPLLVQAMELASQRLGQAVKE